MPYLSIQTNTSLSDDQQSALLDAASKIVASELSKPESYVMVSFVHAQQMKFAGDDSPTAFLELRAIGNPLGRSQLAVFRRCSLDPYQ